MWSCQLCSFPKNCNCLVQLFQLRTNTALAPYMLWSYPGVYGWMEAADAVWSCVNMTPGCVSVAGVVCDWCGHRAALARQVLAELERCQARLKTLSAHNASQLERLLRLGRAELQRQQLREKLAATDAQVRRVNTGRHGRTGEPS